jgi:hypothetical protein
MWSCIFSLRTEPRLHCRIGHQRAVHRYRRSQHHQIGTSQQRGHIRADLINQAGVQRHLRMLRVQPADMTSQSARTQSSRHRAPQCAGTDD